MTEAPGHKATGPAKAAAGVVLCEDGLVRPAWASRDPLLRAATAGAFSFPEDAPEDDELDFGTVLILDGIERLITLAS